MDLLVEKIDKDISLPSYSYPTDAGLDLPSAETMTLQPNEKRVLKTGLRFAIPEGHVGLVWDRSGIAAKYTVHCLAGVIDSHYRGELGVVMINLSDMPFEIKKGDRIAQLLIQPVVQCNIIEDKLDETERNQGGFGSTGR
ncbi:MAG: dUTP diphosphatase [Candidatus Woesearchaeota archaeon]